MLTRKQQWRKTQSCKVISQRRRGISNLSQNEDSLSSVGVGAALSSVSELPKKLRSAISVITFLSYADKLERPKVISLVAVALIYFTFLIVFNLLFINRIRDR
jgi:hypothetical protein